MRTKLFEIRDIGTFVVGVATLMNSGDDAEGFLLRKDGYDPFSNLVLLSLSHIGKAKYDPYDWGDRTFLNSHKYIMENWFSLKSGDVVCVETILGERKHPKLSERIDPYGELSKSREGVKTSGD